MSIVNRPAIVIKAEATIDLHELATQINEAHASSEATLRDSVRHARSCGEMLIQARHRVKRDWLAWLKKNITLSPSTVQRYMRLARRWDEVVAACKDPGQLTFAQAIDLLARGRPRTAGRPALAENTEAIAESYMVADSGLRDIAEHLDTAVALLSDQFSAWAVFEFPTSKAPLDAYLAASKANDPVLAWVSRKPDPDDVEVPGDFSYSTLAASASGVLRRLARAIADGIVSIIASMNDIGSRLARLCPATMGGSSGKRGWRRSSIWTGQPQSASSGRHRSLCPSQWNRPSIIPARRMTPSNGCSSSRR